MMQIILEVEDVTGQMFLKELIGEGEYDGSEVVMCVVLPTMSPIIHYKERDLKISIHEIVKAMCEAYDKSIGDDDGTE